MRSEFSVYVCVCVSACKTQRFYVRADYNAFGIDLSVLMSLSLSRQKNDTFQKSKYDLFASNITSAFGYVSPCMPINLLRCVHALVFPERTHLNINSGI